ncbi:AAA family ATPase, partial [Candidatus Dependentiae bacterium]|nr:AAA family ATPase [Candidatus Dependentiae bacterium]
MQKIFVDIKEFRSIRQDGGLYVDKTKYIYDIIQQGTYFFLARPRRFGKSLLCSTLAELFENNRELFKG